MKNKLAICLISLMMTMLMFGMVSAACSSKTASTSMNNALGVKVLTYSQTVNWCYDGKKILSSSYSTLGKVVIPVNLPLTWLYDKSTLIYEFGGKGQSSYKVKTSGHFGLNFMGVVVQDRYPWIDQTVTATGGYSYRAQE